MAPSDARPALPHPFAPPGAPTSILDSLSRQCQITDQMWAAGTRLRGLWLKAQGLPHGARRRALIRRVDYAMSKIERTEDFVAVFGVCAWNETVAGKLWALQVGLQALARHWRIPADYSRVDCNSQTPHIRAYIRAS